MSTTTVQIRSVPVELYRGLKTRAAIEGMTMSDFIRELAIRALADMKSSSGCARLHTVADASGGGLPFSQRS